MTNQNPHKGHRERVRQKILANGIEGFQPHEILEFLLFHTVPQKDTNIMAHNLISVFGSLENVLEASAEELTEKGKLSLNSAVFLSSLREIFSYYEKVKSSKTPVKTLNQMMDIFRPFFLSQKKEKLIVAFFDSGMRLKNVKEFGRGQENGFRFDARDILRDALTFGAYSVAIAHNHPVSTSFPSKRDINTTSDIKNQLEYFEIRLVEHIIFGTDGIFSFAADEKMSCFISNTF